MPSSRQINQQSAPQTHARNKLVLLSQQVQVALPVALLKQLTKGGDWNQYKTIAQAKKAGSLYYSQNGKKMAAVYKEDLKPGESLRDYMNKKTGKTRKMMAGGMAKKYSKGKTVRGNGIAARSKSCKMR